MSDALMTIYKLVWDDFCSWYLEMVKPEFGKPIDQITYKSTISYFETVLKALHPMMPFITEELWHELKDREENNCIIVASWPEAETFDKKILSEGAFALEVVTEIRNTRNSKGLSPREQLRLMVRKSNSDELHTFLPVVRKLSNLAEVTFVDDAPSGNITSFIVRSKEFYLPLEGKIDASKERENLLKDLEYQKGFIASVDKKLSNEKFVSSAPAQVVEMERKKKADAEAKIKAIEESLSRIE